jgi:hypothetical protein
MNEIDGNGYVDVSGVELDMILDKSRGFTIMGGSEFGEVMLKAREKEPSAEDEEKIKKFVKKNPNIEDEDFHKKAEKLDIKPDEAEEAIYHDYARVVKSVYSDDEFADILSKAQGQEKTGHKYDSRKPGPGGGWIYKYKHGKSGREVEVHHKEVDAAKIHAPGHGAHGKSAAEMHLLASGIDKEATPEQNASYGDMNDILAHHNANLPLDEAKEKKRADEMKIEDEQYKSAKAGKKNAKELIGKMKADFPDSGYNFKIIGADGGEVKIQVSTSGYYSFQGKKQIEGFLSGHGDYIAKEYGFVPVKSEYKGVIGQEKDTRGGKSDVHAVEIMFKKVPKVVEKGFIADFMKSGHKFVGRQVEQDERGNAVPKFTYEHGDSGRRIEVRHDGERAHVGGVEKEGHELAAKVASLKAKEHKDKAGEGGDDVEENMENAKFYDDQAKVAKEHADVLDHHERRQAMLGRMAGAVKVLVDAKNKKEGKDGVEDEPVVEEDKKDRKKVVKKEEKDERVSNMENGMSKSMFYSDDEVGMMLKSMGNKPTKRAVKYVKRTPRPGGGYDYEYQHTGTGEKFKVSHGTGKTLAGKHPIIDGMDYQDHGDEKVDADSENMPEVAAHHQSAIDVIEHHTER